MNSMLVRGRRIAVLIALVSVLLMSFVASASAQDIAVTKITNSSVVAADSNVTYEVTVSNSTGSTGETTLTDAVPANMTFVSASFPESWGCTLPAVGSGGTITCTHAGDLPDESIYSFTFVFHVVSGTPNNTEIVNTANISNASDPNSNNDSSSAMVTVGEPPPPPPPPLALKDVLISEFRLSGPDGSEDQYIELYCNRNIDCSLAGVKLRAFDPTLPPPAEGGPGGGNIQLTFPPVVIPARHFLLIGDSAGYSLIPYGFIDIDMSGFSGLTDNEGFQLVAGEEGTIIDSVGFIGGGNEAQYVEGTGLQRATSRPADQYAYVRRRTLETNGLPQDNNNNSGDFVLVSVTGTPHEGIAAPPVLGAPGPKGLSSPISYSNSQVTGNLVDQTKSKDEDPNRVRVGSGDSGTMSIRRSFTNNTSDTLFFMTFRVIDITTLNSPNTFGNQAELRLISSDPTSAEVPSRGGTVVINGTVLEFDAICGCPEPQQPNGGGLNTSAAVNTEEFLLEPGQTIDVQFLLSVVKAGLYRFYVYVEAFPSQAASGPIAGAADSRARVKQPTPSKFLSVQRVPPVGAIRKPKHQIPVITPMTTTASPNRSTVPVRNAPTPVPVMNAPTPRVIIINRGIAEGEKKPRRKTRLRKKSSAALKKKVEEKFAVVAEKPQN